MNNLQTLDIKIGNDVSIIPYMVERPREVAANPFPPC